MSAETIPIRGATTRRVDPQLAAVESTIAYLGLPTARPPVVRADGVHVIVTSGEDFSEWMFALGGDVNRAPQLDGASLWTLRTETPTRGDGSTVRIRVHVPLVHDEDVPAELHRTMRGVSV